MLVQSSFIDNDEGVRLKHELRIGHSGIGQLFDPLMKLYFNNSYRKELEEHCKIEWFKLAEYLA